MNARRWAWGLILCTAVICSASFTTSASIATFRWGASGDKISELQARFDRETNAVRRAKLLEKLGDLQFEKTRSDFKAHDLAAAALVFEKYRDNARVALAGLKKEHPDAERKSNGYRQLEINLRRAIREVDEILLMAPEEYEPPLQIVRGDLDAMDRELIRLLFKHPDEQPAKKPDVEAKP